MIKLNIDDIDVVIDGREILADGSIGKVIVHRGWLVWAFTGWYMDRPYAADGVLCAEWCAVKPGPVNPHAGEHRFEAGFSEPSHLDRWALSQCSYHGAVCDGVYMNRGDKPMGVPRPDIMTITETSSLEDKELAKRQGLAALLALIENVDRGKHGN